MPSKPKLLIPLADYERIYRLICGVLEGNANTPRACIFFAAVGSVLLEQNYKVKADFRGGAAAFAMHSDGVKATASTFGHIDADGHLVADASGFHCWVEAEGFIIDFMAPLFSQSMRSAGLPLDIPPMMFQRRLSDMAPEPSQIRKLGDFHVARSPELELRVFGDFGRTPMAGDLANIAMHWFRRPPRAMPDNMGMRDNDGNETMLTLKGPRLVGAW